jgi:hypothetical protein
MVETVAPPRSRRLSFWAVQVALAVCALGGVFTLLWFKLPTWAPELVVKHSPWVDPVLRAVAEDSGLYESGRNRVVNLGNGINPSLRARLHDENPIIRSLAAGILGRLKDEESIDQLISMMEYDTDEGCRVEAIEALGLRGGFKTSELRSG